jgi:hypothetical protein
MDIEKVLKDISSGDNHLAWSAGWSIIKANVAELNVIPLDSIAAIRAAVAKLPNLEHSSVVDSREIPKLALKILEFKNSKICRCNLYNSAQRFLPEEEQDRGYIQIEKKNDVPWEPEFYCKCLHCGKKYFVHESHSYHYPRAKWSAIT